MFYGWFVAASAFVTLLITVGIPFYGLPFFYDYFIKEFGWSRAQTTSGIARLSNCQFTDNDTALIVSPGGSILSQASSGGVLTNTVEGNNSNGATTGTYAAK